MITLLRHTIPEYCLSAAFPLLTSSLYSYQDRSVSTGCKWEANISLLCHAVTRGQIIKVTLWRDKNKKERDRERQREMVREGFAVLSSRGLWTICSALGHNKQHKGLSEGRTDTHTHGKQAADCVRGSGKTLPSPALRRKVKFYEGFQLGGLHVQMG